MKREIYIDRSFGVTRAAVIEEGTLVELLFEREANIKQTGSLFLGRVQSIKPSLNATFVDIGLPLNAFLPLREGNSFRQGDFLIVQVETSLPTETKGLRITDRVNLAGKWLVLLPNAEGVRISKKIRDASLREELKRIGEEICPPECGVIVRTASSGMTEELLREEAQTLFLSWKSIQKKAAGMTGPGLLHERAPLGLELMRELSGTELSRVVTNDPALYQALLHEKECWDGACETVVELFDESKKQVLLFDAAGIETQIDKALKRRVWLPSGGYLVIDSCEALTVIDVNSGKMTLGRDAEEAAFRVNLEALSEIARQLRLRNVGGIVVVDLIDMHEREHREQMVRVMREAVSHDRMQVTVEGLTRLGLMELTRKRKGDELRNALQSTCPHCNGNGAVLRAEEIAMRAMRGVRRMVLSGQRGPFVIRCSSACAQALLRQHNPVDVPIYALAAYGRNAENFDIEQLGAGGVPANGAQSLPERTDI